MEENLQNPNLEANPAPMPEPQVKERNKYTWMIIAGIVALVTLGALTLGYYYMQKGSEPVDYTTTITQEESTENEEIVIEDEEDLDPLLTEVDSTSDTKQLEADFNQAVSESSGL